MSPLNEDGAHDNAPSGRAQAGRPVPAPYSALDRAVIGLIWGFGTGVAALLLAAVFAVLRAPPLLARMSAQDVQAGGRGLPAALLVLVGYVVAWAVAGALVGAATAPDWVRRLPALSGFLAGAIAFGMLGGVLSFIESGAGPVHAPGAMSIVGGLAGALYHALGGRLPGMAPDARPN